MKKKLKKAIPVILTCILVLGIIPVSVPADAGQTASGTCGDNMTWVLTADGTLTISGTGVMENFDSDDCPWQSYMDAITSVVIEEGVLSVGDCAFYKCAGLASVSLSDSVTSIGSGAFYNCAGLTGIDIPDGVTSIGEETFSGCSSLKSISLPASVTSIGDKAFYNCTSLTDVYYAGSEDDWAAVSIGFYDTYITYAEISYNSTYAAAGSSNSISAVSDSLILRIAAAFLAVRTLIALIAILVAGLGKKLKKA